MFPIGYSKELKFLIETTQSALFIYIFATSFACYLDYFKIYNICNDFVHSDNIFSYMCKTTFEFWASVYNSYDVYEQT